MNWQLALNGSQINIFEDFLQKPFLQKIKNGIKYYLPLETSNLPSLHVAPCSQTRQFT